MLAEVVAVLPAAFPTLVPAIRLDRKGRLALVARATPGPLGRPASLAVPGPVAVRLLPRVLRRLLPDRQAVELPQLVAVVQLQVVRPQRPGRQVLLWLRVLR